LTAIPVIDIPVIDIDIPVIDIEVWNIFNAYVISGQL